MYYFIFSNMASRLTTLSYEVIQKHRQEKIVFVHVTFLLENLQVSMDPTIILNLQTRAYTRTRVVSLVATIS